MRYGNNRFDVCLTLNSTRQTFTFLGKETIEFGIPTGLDHGVGHPYLVMSILKLNA